MKKITTLLILSSLIFMTSCSNEQNISQNTKNIESQNNADYSQMQSKVVKKAEKIEIVLIH